MSRLIYVCGCPTGGTSAVAGSLHHLGVDMGQLMHPDRPYRTFEDRRCSEYQATPTKAQQFIMGGGRDFRGYIAMRLRIAKPGRRVGVKIGPTYWLGDSSPATLPLDIVKVDRPLEDSIRSDWKYLLQKDPTRTEEDRILRACQLGGYWQAKESLCALIQPVLTIDFYEMLQAPEEHVDELIGTLGLEPLDKQRGAAINFIEPPSPPPSPRTA